MPSPSSSATSRPRRMTSTRCARPITSSSSDEISRTPRPVGGERGEEVVDRALGADVDAARRLVGDHDLRVAEQHPREQHLLLVAARERCRPAPSSSRRARRSDRARRGRPGARDGGARLPQCVSEPRCESVAFSSVERRKTRPSSLRDSGIIASPARRLRLGLRPSIAAVGEHDLARRRPARRRRARARARCARRRRARRGRGSRRRAARSWPTRRRARVSSAHREHDRRVRPAGGCFGGNVEVSGRPSIASTSEASVSVGRRRGLDERAVAQHGDRVGELEHLAAGSARSRMIGRPAGGEPADDLVQVLRLLARRARRSARPSRSAARRARARAGSRPSAARPSAAGRPGIVPGRSKPGRLGERRVGAVEPPAADEPGARAARRRGRRSARRSGAGRSTTPARSRRRCARAPRAASGTRPPRRRAASGRGRRDARRRRCGRASTCRPRSRRRARAPSPCERRASTPRERLDAAEVLGDVQELEVRASASPSSRRDCAASRATQP